MVMKAKCLTWIIVIGFLVFTAFDFFSIDAQGATDNPFALSEVRYWAYQIQQLDATGGVDAIVDSRYDMVVIDPTVTHDYGFDAKDMVPEDQGL